MPRPAHAQISASSHHSSTAAPAVEPIVRLRDDREARPRPRAPRGRGSPAPAAPPASRTRTRPCVVADRRARPPSRSATTRTNARRPGLFETRLEQDRPIDAAAAGGPAGGPPAPGSRAGRTARTSRSSRPGCRAGRTGASVPPSGALRGPERERLARLDRDPPERRSGRSSRTRACTTSYGPTETPPETTIASTRRRRARRTAGPGRPRAGPSRSRASAARAGVLDERREARAVRVGDPGRAEVRARRRRTSSPVARTPTRGRRWTGSCVDAGAGREGDRGGRSASGRPRAPSIAPRAGRCRPSGSTPPTRDRLVDEDTRPAAGPVASRPRGPAAPVRVERRRQLDRDDGVGPGRDRRAGRDPDRGPAPDLDIGCRRPRATSPMTSSRTGASSVAASTSAARIA